MKIVATSNFNEDNYSEYVICDHVNNYWGKLIEKLLQNKVKEHDSAWPVLKPDDYVPFVWEP